MNSNYILLVIATAAAIVGYLIHFNSRKAVENDGEVND